MGSFNVIFIVSNIVFIKSLSNVVNIIGIFCDIFIVRIIGDGFNDLFFEI